MNYRIEKNTVQETLIIPLYARKMCSELYPNLYRDETALRLVNAVDYDFSALKKKSESLMQRFGFLEVAMRQNDLTFEVREYLKTHPTAAVVNLGCGLDNTGRSCDNGSCKLYNLDFADVIAVRNELLPAGEREENIPCDLNDTAWFEKIDASGGAVFFAAGVFYYFLKEQVKVLVRAMADAFPGAVLAFDAANEKAVKLMLKTWLKDAEIKDVGAYFAVSDAKREIGAWDSRLQVSSRGYMLGYNDLKDPSVSGFFRLLSKVGDGMMKMQIVKVRFGDGNGEYGVRLQKCAEKCMPQLGRSLFRVILHAKRAATEEHIKNLQQEGREGIRYTATMPDIPFLILGLLCDIGWMIHLISGIIYFSTNGLRRILDGMALIALIAVVFGIVYTIYMNKIHEKEIATRLQKNMSFGLTVYGGLAGGIIGVLQLANATDISIPIIWMTVGGFFNFVTGLPIYLSFKKGIIYGVQ